MTEAAPHTRRKLIPEMEGPMARWYARQRGSQSQLAEYRARAATLVADLPDGTELLEVAPGPGYLAVELARTGRCRVTGLDISRTFVQLASQYAAKEGVEVDFRHGDVVNMPFAGASFDAIVCEAAFKNFAQPVAALDEMHRVLRPGGTATILDMNHDATRADIAEEVSRMRLSAVNAFVVRSILGGLRRRAYAPARFEQVAVASAFGAADVRTEGVSLVVSLRKAG